jgi:HSP20 family protein
MLKPFFEDVSDFFDDYYSTHPWKLHQKLGRDLAVNMYEADGNVIVEMHVPGVDLADIDIHVEGNRLKVTGTRKDEKEDKNKNYYLQEIKVGSFQRIVTVPVSVIADQATAQLEEGILIITLPKEKGSQPSRVKIKGRP